MHVILSIFTHIHDKRFNFLNIMASLNSPKFLLSQEPMNLYRFLFAFNFVCAKTQQYLSRVFGAVKSLNIK